MQENQPKMSVGAWIGTILLGIIPGVNIVCWILWFFGVGNKNRCSFIRASFIFFLVMVALLVGTYFILTKLVGIDLMQTLQSLITTVSEMISA